MCNLKTKLFKMCISICVHTVKKYIAHFQFALHFFLHRPILLQLNVLLFLWLISLKEIDKVSMHEESIPISVHFFLFYFIFSCFCCFFCFPILYTKLKQAFTEQNSCRNFRFIPSKKCSKSLCKQIICSTWKNNTKLMNIV